MPTLGSHYSGFNISDPSGQIAPPPFLTHRTSAPLCGIIPCASSPWLEKKDHFLTREKKEEEPLYQCQEYSVIGWVDRTDF